MPLLTVSSELKILLIQLRIFSWDQMFTGRAPRESRCKSAKDPGSLHESLYYYKRRLLIWPPDRIINYKFAVFGLYHIYVDISFYRIYNFPVQMQRRWGRWSNDHDAEGQLIDINALNYRLWNFKRTISDICLSITTHSCVHSCCFTHFIHSYFANDAFSASIPIYYCWKLWSAQQINGAHNALITANTGRSAHHPQRGGLPDTDIPSSFFDFRLFFDLMLLFHNFSFKCFLYFNLPWLRILFYRSFLMIFWSHAFAININYRIFAVKLLKYFAKHLNSSFLLLFYLLSVPF